MVLRSWVPSEAEDATWKCEYPSCIDEESYVLPEQPIVPFISTGYDYWFWRETWKKNGNISGSKTGTHMAYGLNILLDMFQPGRASRLQAQTGVTDSYITVEFRSQNVGEDQGGLTFSGDSVTIGLKLDH